MNKYAKRDIELFTGLWNERQSILNTRKSLSRNTVIDGIELKLQFTIRNNGDIELSIDSIADKDNSLLSFLLFYKGPSAAEFYWKETVEDIVLEYIQKNMEKYPEIIKDLQDFEAKVDEYKDKEKSISKRLSRYTCFFGHLYNNSNDAIERFSKAVEKYHENKAKARKIPETVVFNGRTYRLEKKSKVRLDRPPIS